MSVLGDMLLAEGGLLGARVRSGAHVPPAVARTAAAGPRGGPEHELVLWAVHEGYLLHHSPEGSVLLCEDPDLALLAGDRLYALGLERLVALGDLEAVSELADVISLSALAGLRGDRELAAAIWEAGAVAVGWGRHSAHEQAKLQCWAAAPGASAAMRTAAERYRYS